MRTFAPLLLWSAALGALPAAAHSYLPLEAGNRWEYREASTGETMTIRVGTPVIHDGNVYYGVLGYGVTRLYLREDDNGNLRGWDLNLEREYLVTSFEAVPGGWFDTEIGGCPQGGQAQERAVRHTTVGMAEIPALQVNYRTYGCADTGLLEERYAANVGLVRRVVNTIAGLRTYDLVFARTPVLMWDTAPGNLFRVSLSNTSPVCGTDGAEAVTVGMLASPRVSPTMALAFPSAQRYDIRVRNEAGEVVYQWSEGVGFAQVAATVALDREVEYRQEIPLRKRDGQRLESGIYTVEAWLTTENREFAGASSLAYTGCQATEGMAGGRLKGHGRR